MTRPRLYVSKKEVNMKAVCYYFNQKITLCGYVTKILAEENLIVIKIGETELKIDAPYGDGLAAAPFLSEMWLYNNPLIINYETDGVRIMNGETEEEIFIEK